MKVLIIGATGSVGKHLVQQSLAQGHEVTALTRSPENADFGISENPGNLKVFKGDVLDPPSIDEAFKGQDAVLVTLGAGLKGKVRSQGTQNVINAMKKHGVDRLVCQTTLGVGESNANLNFKWKYIMFGGLLRAAFKDHVMQENHVKTSKLNWTIVRPSAFTDNEFTGNYKHGFGSEEQGLSLSISRADVAHFMTSQIANLEYVRQTPGVSN